MKEKIGFWSAVSIGIGGMVGGGIFAVLGLAVQLAGGATPLAFAIAGLVALITSHSYAFQLDFQAKAELLSSSTGLLVQE